MTVHLVCGNEAFDVRMQVLNNLSPFQQDPELLEDAYRVKSKTDSRVFREFLSALSGEDIELDDRNISALSDLCKEFGFDKLKMKIDEYVRAHSGLTHLADAKQTTDQIGAMPEEQSDDWKKRLGDRLGKYENPALGFVIRVVNCGERAIITGTKRSRKLCRDFIHKGPADAKPTVILCDEEFIPEWEKEFYSLRMRYSHQLNSEDDLSAAMSPDDLQAIITTPLSMMRSLATYQDGQWTCVIIDNIIDRDVFKKVATSIKSRSIIGLYDAICDWRLDDYVLLASLFGQCELNRSSPDVMVSALATLLPLCFRGRPEDDAPSVLREVIIECPLSKEQFEIYQSKNYLFYFCLFFLPNLNPN